MMSYQEAVAFLTQQFGFEADSNAEDWELLVSDPERVGEFIRFMEQRKDLDPMVRKVLMAVTLFSYDEYMSDDTEKDDTFWEDIEDLADSEPELHHNTLTYWAVWEDFRTKRDDPFAITPMVRQYLMTRERPRRYIGDEAEEAEG